MRSLPEDVFDGWLNAHCVPLATMTLVEFWEWEVETEAQAEEAKRGNAKMVEAQRAMEEARRPHYDNAPGSFIDYQAPLGVPIRLRAADDPIVDYLVHPASPAPHVRAVRHEDRTFLCDHCGRWIPCDYYKGHLHEIAETAAAELQQRVAGIAGSIGGVLGQPRYVDDFRFRGDFEPPY